MPATKAPVSLWEKTPVCETGGGDYTLVNDATQKDFPLGKIYAYIDASGRPRVIKYVQYNPTAVAAVGPIATLNTTPTAGGTNYTQADVGKVVAITSGGINGAVTITQVNSGSGTGAVTLISATPAAAGQNFTVTTGLTTAAAPSGGSGLTVAPTVLAGFQQGSPLYYKDETRTVVTNVVTEAATYIASGYGTIWSFAGLGMNPTSPTVGGYCFVQIGGFSDKVLMPASTALGGMLLLTNSVSSPPTANTLVYLVGTTDLTAHAGNNAFVAITTAAAAAGGFGHGWICTPFPGV